MTPWADKELFSPSRKAGPSQAERGLASRTAALRGGVSCCLRALLCLR